MTADDVRACDELHTLLHGKRLLVVHPENAKDPSKPLNEIRFHTVIDNMALFTCTEPAAHADLSGEVRELVEALESIGGLSRALRSGGPDPMDLQELSDALHEAVDTAHAALAKHHPTQYVGGGK